MQAFFHNSENIVYNLGMPGGRPTEKKPTDFGARIAEARINAGLSQNELAEKTGYKRHLIANWERKAVSLKAEQLVTLANALNVTTDYLLGREQNNKAKGPSGKLRKLFDEINQLPRYQQQKVISSIEDSILIQKIKKAS